MRRKCRAGMRAVASIGAAVGLAILVAGCAGQAGPQATPQTSTAATSTPTSPIAAGVLIRIVPDRTTVKAGATISATVRIENTTGHGVAFSDHACDGNLVVGIASKRVPLEVAWPAAACAAWVLPTTGIHYRAELITTYRSCGSSAGTALGPVPPCGPGGQLPPLPAGSYATTAAWSGIDAKVELIDPVTITLTP